MNISTASLNKALASITAGLFIAWSSPSAWAACADETPVLDEIRLTHAKRNYRAELCLMGGAIQGVENSGNGVIQLNLFAVTPDSEALEATLLETVRVEGQLRKIRFDRAAYLLHREYPTLALRADDRYHGVGLEQYLSNLLLYMPQGRKLRRVAELTVECDSWEKQCDQDCGDSVHSRAVVVVLSHQTQGYRDIQLKTRTRVTPKGTGTPKLEKETTLWRWNGEQYEIQ